MKIKILLLFLLISPLATKAENCSLSMAKLLSFATNEKKQAPLTHVGIERLDSFLSNLPEEQRAELFDLLAGPEMQNFLIKIENEEIDHIALEKVLNKYPGIEEVIFDWINFGDLYPGIFLGINRMTMIPRILGFLKQDGSKKVLASLTEARTKSMGFRYSTIQSTTSTIRNAIDDYLGLTYNVNNWERLKQRVSRYFFPLHGRAQKVIEFAHNTLHQAERMLAVDKVIVEQGINKAEEYNLNDQALSKLTYFIGDTVDDMDDLVKLNKNIFGEKFDYNKAVYIQNANIYGVEKRLSQIDQYRLMENYDLGNLNTLYRMNAILEKNSGRAREMSKYGVSELQLLFGGQHRQTYRYKNSYKKITSETSNESYNVTDEEVYYVTEGTGKDARTVRKVRYVTRTIRPSFEDILNDSYTRGSHSTSSHLSTIRERASKMVATEAPIRELVYLSDELVQEIEEKFVEITVNGKGAEDYKQKLQSVYQELLEKRKFMQDYANWGKHKIQNQYSEDDIENFQKRNKGLLTRIINLEKQIRVISELFDRDAASPYITFETPWSFDHWMEILLKYRNRNYALKGAQATAVAGSTGLYFLNDDVQEKVDSWSRDGVSAIRELLQLQR